MRVYKIMVKLSLIIYISLFIIFNLYKNYYSHIYNNDYIISIINKNTLYLNKNKILIFGSSNVFYGLSAEIISKITNYDSINLATTGIGFQFLEFTKLLLPFKNNSNTIIILSDRSYRSKDISDEYSSLLNQIKSISLVFNLRNLFINKQRTIYGDSVDYATKEFNIPDFSPILYPDLNVTLMKIHIDAAKELGMCPILSLTPYLVNQSDLFSNITASERLFKMIIDAGIEQHFVFSSNIEVDKSFFQDDSHMSMIGRERWTNLLANEILNRNLCDINRVSPKL
jgi:hypothetical protein